MLTAIILMVTVITASLPIFMPRLVHYLGIKTYGVSAWLPPVAAVLFFISFYLPDVHISSQTTTFQQHLIGGGAYSALLYMYAKKFLGWKFNWLIDSLVLFAWVSALGVANKLLEFALAESHLMVLDMGDAYWDLLANTVGAYLAYAAIRLVSVVRFSQKSR